MRSLGDEIRMGVEGIVFCIGWVDNTRWNSMLSGMNQVPRIVFPLL